MDVCMHVCVCVYIYVCMYVWVKFTEACVMCVENHVLVKTIFTKGLNIGSPLKTHWFSGKEKVSGTAVNEEGQADHLLFHEKPHRYWFPITKFLGKIHYIYTFVYIQFLIKIYC